MSRISRIWDLCMSESIQQLAILVFVWRLFTVNLLNLHLLSHVLPHKKYKMNIKKIYAKFLSENSMDESEIATVSKKSLTCADLNFDSKLFHNFFFGFLILLESHKFWFSSLIAIEFSTIEKWWSIFKIADKKFRVKN